MMEWKTLNKSEVCDIITGWTSLNDVVSQPTVEYIQCRKDMIQFNQDVKMKLSIQSHKGKEYQYDLEFGLRLYVYLKSHYFITVSEASNNSLWIFLGVKVIPDIVFERWGADAHNRFYSNPRRIWLKALWWYIHLSWQGDEQSTREVIKNNTTDEIVQLVERSGTSGYRIRLCREIMRQYGGREQVEKTRSTKLFRRAMKLNTARLTVLEPALYEGEEEEYVNELFNGLAINQPEVAGSY